jgi:hypothetical protein
MLAFSRSAAIRLPGHLALGGGGLAHWLVRLIIWHELWRLGHLLWRIPTFGPIIAVLIVVILIGLVLLRQRGGPGWWRRRGRRQDTSHGTGPRDW